MTSVANKECQRRSESIIKLLIQQREKKEQQQQQQQASIPRSGPRQKKTVFCEGGGMGDVGLVKKISWLR
jgi:hypothetical protein